MRVSVYKGEADSFAVLVEPSPGRRLHPVMLSDVLLGDLKEKVRAVVDEMRRVSTRPQV